MSVTSGSARVGGDGGAMSRPSTWRCQMPSGRDDEALRSEHAEDADHREAAVIDLGDEGLRLALGRHLLGKRRVPQVEREQVQPVLLVEEAVEQRVVAGLAALDVVLLAVRLDRGELPILEEADGADDLDLRLGGERVPLRARAARRDVAERDGRAAEGASKAPPVRPQWMPFDCTQKPTNAAIATRPCLISAWRNQPTVAVSVDR